MSSDGAETRFQIMTPPEPGAIGILQVTGGGTASVIERLTGAAPSERAHLCDLGGIDEGLVVALRDDWFELMPHGGPHVMRCLAERFMALGAKPFETPADARLLYPEAASALEAEALATLARAASDAAIDVLLAQPERWARALRDGAVGDAEALLDRSRALDHLIRPPSVVLAGRANVGKSTLSNRMLGRQASLTADAPGTTRDWVGGMARLPLPGGETLAVRWLDTPGWRSAADPLEQRAMALARSVIAEADVLVAVRDASHADPDASAWGRAADLRVWNKIDLAPCEEATACGVSARTGAGLDRLASAIVGHLGLEASAFSGLWAFSDRLKHCLNTRDEPGLRAHAGLA